LYVEYGDDPYKSVSKIGVKGYEGIDDLALLDSIGQISALVRAYGYGDDGMEEGEVNYPYILSELDRLAREVAKAFNEQHKAGVDLYGNGGDDVEDFFIINGDGAEITAENITVNPNILKDPNLIAASLPDQGSRNANYALELAYVFDKEIANLKDSSIRNFYTLLIGEIGVKGQEAVRMKENTEILRTQVEEQRMSVSAVSLDEEMTNL